MKIESLYKLYQKNFLVDTDTRKIRKGTIYFALKGENFNGNTFASEALNKGAIYSVVDEKEQVTSDQIILVNDVLATLQELAAYHRLQLKVPIIALTGSNGKTTTKELINAVLSTTYRTTATIGNLNNHIGVPLTLLSMTPETEIGIVEMGANHPKEIEFLCSVATPDFGYITNFGKAHLEGFGSIEGVIEAKSEMYAYLENNSKVVFVNPEDQIQLEKTNNINRILFDVGSIQFTEVNPFVKISYNAIAIQTNLIGVYNFSNISAAITIGKYFDITSNKIKKALENYISTNNRSQIIKTENNTIILDAYNANPTSMIAAIDNFNSIKATEKTVILGDMFELGTNSPNEHQLVADCVSKLEFDHCILVGELFYATNTTCLRFKTQKEAFNHLKITETENNHILIKGSRGMALENLLKAIT
jgi:UDP-N-acetylmuramoyl-tripeptide--D-alanyl-D-alanine ligase